MRVWSTAWTVSGTAGAPGTKATRLNSSRKKGLPSARFKSCSVTDSGMTWLPMTARTTCRLSWGDSGGSATWVA